MHDNWALWSQFRDSELKMILLSISKYTRGLHLHSKTYVILGNLCSRIISAYMPAILLLIFIHTSRLHSEVSLPFLFVTFSAMLLPLAT
jgi:hypothetical protein